MKELYQVQKLTLFFIFSAIIVLIGGFFAFKMMDTSPYDRVVLITIDTLRANHLRSLGYPRSTSPFLDSLAERGISFKHAFSASSHTSPSHASIFSGLLPLQHGLRTNGQYLNPKVFNIAQLFTEQGYGVAGFPAVKFLEGRVGFPTITSDSRLYSNKNKKAAYLEASINVDRVISWLDRNRRQKRMFLWIHFYDVHETKKEHLSKEYLYEIKKAGQLNVEYYINRHGIPDSFYKSHKALLDEMDAYDSQILRVDKQIHRLFREFKARNLDTNTLWVITSDHGEGLGNHNYRGHGRYIYREQVHVPLIFYAQPNLGPKKITNLAKSMDIFPTLADLINKPLDSEALGLQGISLASLFGNTPSFPTKTRRSFAQRRPKESYTFRKTWEDGKIYGLRDLEFSYIYHSHGKDELYSLAEDPFEERNILEDAPEIAAAMANDLMTRVEKAKNKTYLEVETELDSETIENLRSLGYL